MKSLSEHAKNLEKIFKKPYLCNSDFTEEGDVSIVSAIYEMLKFELEDEKQKDTVIDKEKKDE